MHLHSLSLILIYDVWLFLFQIQRLPFLQSSNLALDTLKGSDESIGFEDILNGKRLIHFFFLITDITVEVWPLTSTLCLCHVTLQIQPRVKWWVNHTWWWNINWACCKEDLTQITHIDLDSHLSAFFCSLDPKQKWPTQVLEKCSHLFRRTGEGWGCIWEKKAYLENNIKHGLLSIEHFSSSACKTLIQTGIQCCFCMIPNWLAFLINWT